MQPNSALRFALYTPQAYTPLGGGTLNLFDIFLSEEPPALLDLHFIGWTCAGCSGSLAAYTAHPAFAGVIATFIIMFLSGFHLLRHAPGLR